MEQTHRKSHQLERQLFQPGQYPELDGLRAIAIILVMATHLFQTIPGLSLVFWKVEWASPLFNGWIGVDLFFVLSGFLIGGQILKQIKNNTFSFKKFYQRRFFRILPAYFTMLIAITAMAYFSPQTYGLIVDQSFSWKGLVKNVFLFSNYFPHSMGVGSWSLSIEEQFYWIIPLTLFFLKKLDTAQKIKLLFGICFLALILRMFIYRQFDLGADSAISLVQQKIYFPFHTRMDSLAAGVLVFLAHDSTRESPHLQVLPMACRWIGFSFVAFVFITGALKGGWFETTIQYSLLAFGFSCIVWGILAESKKSVSQSTKILRKLFWIPVARLSYSLYLVHLISFRAGEVLCNHYGVSNLILKLSSMLILSIVLASALHFIVEEPARLWSKKQFALG